MKCRVGDLALVIGGPKENLGKMVTCETPVTGFVLYGELRYYAGPGIAWKVDQMMNVLGGALGGRYMAPFLLDDWLCPIRPERDGVDDERETDGTLYEYVGRLKT